MRVAVDNEPRLDPAATVPNRYRGRARPQWNPGSWSVSTSFVERQNLGMRMGTRRFTRLTNGFSKKVDNHRRVAALFIFMCRDFGRVHQTLRVTPAMESGISNRVWSTEEIRALLPVRKPNTAKTENAVILQALGEQVS